MLDQILYEVALEFHTNNFTIFLDKISLCMPSYWIPAWSGLQVTINVNKFKNGFMVSMFIQIEIRNVFPGKKMCFLSLFKT